MTRKERLIDDQCHPTQEDVIVEGTVDGGLIEKLKSSVIGTAINIFSAEKLLQVLESRGLCEFDVRQIAGNQFLIDFEREELCSQVLNWEWEWLSEIFSAIVSWGEGFRPTS
ncbi:hypothetical protein V6N13_049534 [Hibiscus sabdariffa]|uniref:DUF4283 domain-containing protein n=1 Tax=Hibiscus sabdariffa TaxID=183260 RepID=A0ABR2QX87_9ROSI